MTNLERYATWLNDHAENNPISSRPDTPNHLDVKTLWIPVYSGNRTVTIDLNHGRVYHDDNGNLFGNNGNCDTAYRVIEIPIDWDYTIIEGLAQSICERLDKPFGYPKMRVFKADDRMSVILEEIDNLINVRA